MNLKIAVWPNYVADNLQYQQPNAGALNPFDWSNRMILRQARRLARNAPLANFSSNARRNLLARRAART